MDFLASQGVMPTNKGLIRHGLQESWAGAVRLAAAWGRDGALELLLCIPHENRSSGKPCWCVQRGRIPVNECECFVCRNMPMHKNIDAVVGCGQYMGTHGLNALGWAGTMGYLRSLRLLLEAGADPAILWQLMREKKLHKRTRAYMYILTGALSRAPAARSGTRVLGAGHTQVHNAIASFL